MIRKTEVKRSIIGVLAACTFTVWAVIFIPGVELFLVVNVVFYAFNAVSIPLLQDMVAKKAQGEHSNLIMGFYNATKSLGGIIGSLVAGFIYTRGPKLAFVFAGIVLLVATLFSVVYRRMRDSGPAEQAGC